MNEQDLAEVKARLHHLEAELTALKAVVHQGLTKQPLNPTPVNASESVSFDPVAAEATFRQALLTLKTIATLRNERFIFIATADSNNVTTSGPQPVQALLTEEIKPLLAKLGGALSSPTRLKMLYLLFLQEECTTAVLTEISGVSGGNLFQQLNELYSANLIFQPSRGRYRLTELGRFGLEMLTWGISNIGKTWKQSPWFEDGPA